MWLFAFSRRPLFSINCLTGRWIMVGRLTAVLAIISLGLSGCHEAPKEVAVKEPSFVLTDSLLNRIQLETVRRAPVRDELKLTGKIAYDEEHVNKVFPLVSGIVTKVNAGLGQYVKAGQVLAELESSDIAGFRNESAASNATLATAQRALASTKELFQNGLASEREYEEAKQEVLKARAEVQRNQAVGNIYGTRSGSSSARYQVKAPESGFVVEKAVNPRTLIRPDNDQTMFTISDLKSVWVTASVFEDDIARVQPGQAATITTLAFPGKVYHGKIDNTYSALDPESKVMRVRIRLANPENRLKPEMFANVTVTSLTDSVMLSVPSSALVFERSRNFILVFHDRNNIETRPVTPGPSANGITYIRAGLKPGEQVVSNDPLLLYHALNK
ncbi:efflux RND transporter periplasmic adaptor subunit [Hymenobacter sp. GOD-10R]|uniref:efflux RND transporter periplasmic adaptor subunit n=1 Tax=Hymenobacter sp. GOD-10R TaxID=3093922 RepID=UPI002D796332|nr:efflux RND transporter periplasmic adaptor subunit [Hymenobacter sp. GOD-10R]WRQ26341.1 efflux RND transporter periplasmic adaptor subunit [Hymenobacter sp. GOD-10R]